MSEHVERELVQYSRIFYEAFLPGAVTRLRGQALAQIVGVSDREGALDGLDRTQLLDAVRKYLADWKRAGGALDALIEEASEKDAFSIQAPGGIFVTPYPLVLRCGTCGALENHDKPRRQHEQVLATTYNRVRARAGSGKATLRCTRPQCGGRMIQVPFVVVHRCGHVTSLSTPPAARGYGQIGLRANTGMYRQNVFFDLLTDENITSAHTDMCPACTAGRIPDPSALQKGTPVSGGDAFYPQAIQFVALSKGPGELISSIQAELAQLAEARLVGRTRDLAEGVAYGLIGCIESELLQDQLLAILAGGTASDEELAAIAKRREALESELLTLNGLIEKGLSLHESRDSCREMLSKLTSQMGAAEGTFAAVRQFLKEDAVLLDLVGQRRTMEAVLLRHDVGRQSIEDSIAGMAGGGHRASRAHDWEHVRSTYGVQDIAHIPDLRVVLTAVGFTREKAEPERDSDQIPVKLNPFEDQVRQTAKGKAMLYALSAQTEALWIKLDPIKILQWCVKSAGWEMPPPNVFESATAAQAHLLNHCPALTADPGRTSELTKTLGAQVTAPFQLLHSITHALMLTARRHSGYDNQSLTEYLLPMDLSFLIYVTSVQNYTAGGLLTLFQHYTRRWFDDASVHAFNCAFDPICSDVGAACPGCIQIPRGCECFNAGVSRAYLHGGHVDKAQSLWIPNGYWQP